MEKTTKLILEQFKKIINKQHKDFRIYPGSYREKPAHFAAEDMSV